jgi:hypothetical protein
MKLRQEVLSILLEKYGGEINEDGLPKHSPQSIYECAHDWVRSGNEISAGVVAFYKAYYTDYGRYRNV